MLDHLANRFIRDGWSVKKLVRALVLTRAYQLGSDSPAAHRAVDPANRLVWRHTPRRLDAEEIRDAMLAAAGTLDLKRPAGSPAMNLKMIEMRDNGPEARAIREQADSEHAPQRLPAAAARRDARARWRRSTRSSRRSSPARRDATTVPARPCILLNSSFVRRQSLTLAERLLAEKDAADADRIRKAYRLTLGRLPDDKEVERAQTFLTEYEIGCPRADCLQTTGTPKPVAAARPNESRPPQPANPDEIDRTSESAVEDGGPPEGRPIRRLAELRPGAVRIGGVPLPRISSFNRA